MRIGRGDSCELRLSDMRVSRLHATIEAMSGHHLLKDARSANGTSINGARLAADAAFVLREGDEILVGDTRIIYGHDVAAHRQGGFELERSPDVSYPLAALLGDAGPGADEDLSAAFVRAFAGAPRAQGLGRSLELVGRRLSADVVAIFVPKGEGMEVAAAAPAEHPASRLAEVARPIMASERGRLVRALGTAGSRVWSETQQIDASSAAAVPLCHGAHPIGVLAVERRRGAWLERADLARLARMGERLAATLELLEADEGETRLGVGD